MTVQPISLTEADALLEALAGIAFGVVVALGIVAMVVATIAPIMQRLMERDETDPLPRKPRLPKGGG